LEKEKKKIFLYTCTDQNPIRELLGMSGLKEGEVGVVGE
jgi:hypothetical protein